MSAKPWISYLLAVLATIAAVGFRYLLDYSLDTQFNFLLPFIIAVVVAAWHGGLWCGLFATVLNIVVGVGFAMNTDHFFRVMASEWVRISLFAGAGITISLLSESLHQQRQMAEVTAAEADRRRTEIEREIAGRQAAESLARQWESVFNKASWAVAVIDPLDNRLTAVNPAFAVMHGLNIEDFLGMPLASVYAPESRSELPTHIQVASHNTTYTYESVHIR